MRPPGGVFLSCRLPVYALGARLERDSTNKGGRSVERRARHQRAGREPGEGAGGRGGDACNLWRRSTSIAERSACLRSNSFTRSSNSASSGHRGRKGDSRRRIDWSVCCSHRARSICARCSAALAGASIRSAVSLTNVAAWTAVSASNPASSAASWLSSVAPPARRDRAGAFRARTTRARFVGEPIVEGKTENGTSGTIFCRREPPQRFEFVGTKNEREANVTTNRRRGSFHHSAYRLTVRAEFARALPAVVRKFR